MTWLAIIAIGLASPIVLFFLVYGLAMWAGDPTADALPAPPDRRV